MNIFKYLTLPDKIMLSLLIIVITLLAFDSYEEESKYILMADNLHKFPCLSHSEHSNTIHTNALSYK